jgi:5-methylcytosine-specific restriction endonuclease McrA
MLNSSVLLLNQNFVPLMLCTARRAIIMVWSGKAEIVASTGEFVHSVNISFSIPSIIRLIRSIQVHYPWDIQLTKQNIIRRDRGICQYCGKKDGRMTIDHVIPRLLGGDETWNNLVCACPACNNRKGHRSLHDAGMTLLRTPKKPSLGSFLFSHKIQLKRDWQPYLMIR